MQLAAGGRVVLADRRASDPPLPPDLRTALREWGAVAATVRDSGSAEQRELVRRRGRQLASQIAEVRGRPVDYVDPVTGVAEPVTPRGTGPLPRAGPGGPGGGVVVHPDGSGPTPWATGLPIAAFFAVLVALGDVVLSTAFGAAFGLLWVPANLLVTFGLAPSLWLLRTVPFWRWPALGAAVGLGTAWLVLLLGTLG